MDIAELLSDSLGRVRDDVREVVDGLDEDQLAWRPDEESNSIAWLVWHLTRIEDDHVADVADIDQVWTSQGWYDRFGLPFPPHAHGWGHTPAEVSQVKVPGDLLADYHAAVAEMTLDYVGSLKPADLDRIVDDRWDPPASLGVRLVSVVNEVNQHLGQAAYLRGLVERRS